MPGCFVEVPGPPAVERTGHIMRAADLRGWCRDDKGKGHQIDVMNGSKADATREQTNCLWSLSDDGWFRMAMGGMIHYRYPNSVDITAPTVKTVPDYMNEEVLRALDFPKTINVKRIVRQGTRVHVELDFQTNAKTPGKAKVFFGPEDMLTFDHRWANSLDLGELATGVQRISFDGAPASGYCRILVTNETGSYFTPDSSTWK